MKDLNEKISISLNEFEIEVERKNIGGIGIDSNFSISNIFIDAKSQIKNPRLVEYAMEFIMINVGRF